MQTETMGRRWPCGNEAETGEPRGPQGAGRGREGPFLEPLEGTEPHHHLTVDFRPPERDNELLLR